MVLLSVGGMPIFDSIVHSLGTAGTGGFGIKNSSIASYSPYCQWVIAVFMMLFGVNFNIYYLIVARRIKSVFKSRELLWYLSFIAFSTLLRIILTLLKWERFCLCHAYISESSTFFFSSSDKSNRHFW